MIRRYGLESYPHIEFNDTLLAKVAIEELLRVHENRKRDHRPPIQIKVPFTAHRLPEPPPKPT